jgi:hypothetical protein
MRLKFQKRGSRAGLSVPRVISHSSRRDHPPADPETRELTGKVTYGAPPAQAVRSAPVLTLCC